MQRRRTTYHQSQHMHTSDYEIFHTREPYYRAPDFHSHDFLEIYTFLDGNVTYYIEDQVYELSAQDILVIPPGKMHRPVITKEATVYERIVLWINLDFFERMVDIEGTYQKWFDEMSQQKKYLVQLGESDFLFVHQLFTRLLVEYGSNSEYKMLQQSYLATATALIRMYHDKYKEEVTKQSKTQADPVIQNMIGYINAHLTEELTLEKLSNEFYLSKYHLIRKFKEYTNATVYDYILEKRLALAKRYLRNGMPPTMAAMECGFGDYSSFYKAFHIRNGMSPSAFLKLIRQGKKDSKNDLIF